LLISQKYVVTEVLFSIVALRHWRFTT